MQYTIFKNMYRYLSHLKLIKLVSDGRAFRFFRLVQDTFEAYHVEYSRQGKNEEKTGIRPPSARNI